MTVRILLADDHIVTRGGIRAALEDHGLVVCAVADSAPAAVRAAIEHEPDVCILGVRIRGGAIAAAREIRAASPHTHIVMLSASESEDELFASLRAGAAGYLVTDTDPARLGFAIEGVLDGEAAIPRRLVARLVEEFRQPKRQRALAAVRAHGVALSDREWEVLELLRDGHTTKAIALRLELAEATVRRHVSAATAKLHAPNRVEAVKRLDDMGA